MGERRERSKPRNTNRGLMGLSNVGGLSVRVVEDGAGKSNGEKGSTTITEQQYKNKKNICIKNVPGVNKEAKY